MRKYPIDENLFDVIDTDEKAYFVGFLLADGSISDEGDIRFAIQERDIEILSKFKEWFNLAQPITFRNIKEKRYAQIRIGCKKWCQELAKIGIGPRKTKDAHYPTIPDKFFWSFMLGFSDGDGCVYFGERGGTKRIASWSLTCHEQIVKSLTERITTETGIHISVQKHWRTDYIRSLSINGNRNTYGFLSYLYAKNLGLQRKYDKFLLLKEYYSLRRLARQHLKGCYLSKSGKWTAEIKHLDEKQHIGTFDTEEEAGRAYDTRATLLKGSRAELNFPK